MLNFAPDLIEDELLGSYAARWRFLSGLGQKTFCVALAGRQVTFHALNAARFVALESTCGVVDDQNWVEENMTLYPFARLFLGEAINVRHFTPGKELQRSGTGVEELRQRPWGTLTLKHCPECARENRLDDGVAAWRRTHNLPGVTACLKHSLKLIEVSHDPKSLRVLRVQPDAEPHSEASLSELWFAEMARDLLVANLPVVYREQFKRSLHAGLVRTFGRMEEKKMQSAILRALEDEFDQDLLRIVGAGTVSARMAIARILEDDTKPLNPAHVILLAKLTHEGGVVELFREALTFKIAPLSHKKVVTKELFDKRVAAMEVARKRTLEKRRASMRDETLISKDVVMIVDES